jgi:hypothetical protein
MQYMPCHRLANVTPCELKSLLGCAESSRVILFQQLVAWVILGYCNGLVWCFLTMLLHYTYPVTMNIESCKQQCKSAIASTVVTQF